MTTRVVEPARSVVLNAALSCDPDRSLLDDLVGIRKLLEREMTRSAAVWLTEDALDALGENLDTMATVFDDYDRFMQHLRQRIPAIVMRASASPIGYTIVRAIHRYGGSQSRWCRAPRESLERTLRQHRAIYEARAPPPSLQLALRKVRACTRPAEDSDDQRCEHCCLTSSHHSYDDCSSCESQPSMSS